MFLEVQFIRGGSLRVKTSHDVRFRLSLFRRHPPESRQPDTHLNRSAGKTQVAFRHALSASPRVLGPTGADEGRCLAVSARGCMPLTPAPPAPRRPSTPRFGS